MQRKQGIIEYASISIFCCVERKYVSGVYILKSVTT